MPFDTGMGSFIGPMVTGAASSFFKGAAAQGGQRLAGAAVDKVMGIPNPQPKTGAALGADMKAYQDQAFPGTNPWERLGTSYPGGSVEAAKQSGKVQKEMQSKELATRVQVADIGAQAHVQAAATSIGSKAVESAVGTQQGFKTQPYKTPAQSQIKLLDKQTIHETKKIIISGHEGNIKKEQARVARKIADYSKTTAKHSSLLASLENAIKEKDITAGTAIAVAKGGALVVGAGVAIRFVRGVSQMLRSFARIPKRGKVREPLASKITRRPQMNPQTKKGPAAPPYPGSGKLSKKAVAARRKIIEDKYR